MWVIIPAAGSGRRMGASDRPKQYLPLAGLTVIEWAAAPFLRHPDCSSIVIVLARADAFWPESALAMSAQPDDWVLVHDAARPCLSDEDLNRLISALQDDPVGGLLAAPVADTLKRADEEGYVAATVPRQGLWRALTPQMFRFQVLQRALANALERGATVTDESQAIELLGLRPKLIAASGDNSKITTPKDLDHAARVLAARGEQ